MLSRCWRSGCPPGSSLYDAHNIGLMHTCTRPCARTRLPSRPAHVVQNGEVVIVDEFTGRLMSGRRCPTACTSGRGEGGRVDPAGTRRSRRSRSRIISDVRFCRYDGHRGHRGVRVPADLPPRDGRDSDAHDDGAQGRERPGVPDAGREGRRNRCGHQDCHERGSRCWSARRPSKTPRCSPATSKAGLPHGAEREAARARGRDRRAGGAPKAVTIATNMAGRGTDIAGRCDRARPRRRTPPSNRPRRRA